MEHWEYECDKWLTTPPDELETKFFCEGEGCDNEFYPDDTYYEIEGMRLCEECAKEWLANQARRATERDCYD